MVRSLSTGQEKIFTVEDPVEYAMEGVCQTSVNRKAGLTFASLLRSLVRQNPDVLLVGEIRDDETAEIATHAALTGHLVLSTLHTTDAVSSLHRLVDMGVPDYLAVHTLEAVLAQRLARRVCESCAVDVEASRDELTRLGDGSGAIERYRRGSGCERCRGTGFKGRIGLFEVLTVSDDVRAAFLGRVDRRQLVEAATAAGMRTLREDGLAKIAAGVTTPEEVLRVT
jgi:type II secretory ATPase GspE/PulE/Tfp pilus assembly ATPase PilB-like protein